MRYDYNNHMILDHVIMRLDVMKPYYCYNPTCITVCIENARYSSYVLFVMLRQISQ